MLLGFLPLIARVAFLGAIYGQARPHSKCRCLFGDSSCWPSDADFASLSSQLSQPLIFPVPPQSACYSNSTAAESECAKVIEHNYDGHWRADQPGAMQAPNFESFVFANGSISACYLNSTLGVPCEQGNIPPVGVDARTAEDVKAAVMFAERWNLKVVIKNTGHDYLGRSAARGAFMIWTHNLKNTSYDPAFVPQNAPSNETYHALTFGSGIQWHEAYRVANENQRLLIGGVSSGGTVGAAGGWILGGGHSAFSPAYGLGVDNALEFTIVTSTGSYLTVNAHTYPDLFWALRGGGGGTYGVLTSVTYKTYPDTPVVGISLDVNFTSASSSSKEFPVAQSVINQFLGYYPKFSDLGWGGYAFFDKGRLGFYGVAPKTSWEKANETIWPLVEGIRANTKDVSVDLTRCDDFHSWFPAEGIFGGGEDVGFSVEMSSRLIPRARFTSEEERRRLVEKLLGLDTKVYSLLVGGGQVSRVDPDSMGLNPVWRNVLGLMTVAQRWDPAPETNECQPSVVDPDQAQTVFGMGKGTWNCNTQDIQRRLRDYLHTLDVVAGPDAGAYFNEASLYEQDSQKTFFGNHYTKLEAIKDKYDPSGLFVIDEGVGSERWDKELVCLK